MKTNPTEVNNSRYGIKKRKNKLSMKSIRKGDLLSVLQEEGKETYAQVSKVCKDCEPCYYEVFTLVEDHYTDFMMLSTEETRVESDEIIAHVKVLNKDYKTAWNKLGILQLPDCKYLKNSEYIGSEDSERSLDETDTDLSGFIVSDEETSNSFN